MAPRGRGQTENKGSATQEVISPPAFLGAKLTCLKDSYTGINGRRKQLSQCPAHNLSIIHLLRQRKYLEKYKMKKKS
jgi:hypothetical protein